jgi:hypothetical protein
MTDHQHFTSPIIDKKIILFGCIIEDVCTKKALRLPARLATPTYIYIYVSYCIHRKRFVLGGSSGLQSMMRQFQQGGGPGGLGKLFGSDK